MDSKPYIVYVKTDDIGRIISVMSSVFLHNTEGQVAIDSGDEERYYHAQSSYFPKSLLDDRGVWQYKLENGCAVERTQEEMDADYAALPKPAPTQVERITALEEELKAAKILLGLEE